MADDERPPLESFDSRPSLESFEEKQAKGEKQPEIEGEEPGVVERFVGGATEAPRAVMQGVSRLLPESKASETPPAATPAKKAKPREIEGFDPIAFAGGMTNPVPFGAAAAMNRAASPMVKGLSGPMAGGIAALMQPVPEGTKDFVGAKTQQFQQGLALGFGFTFGGKAVSKSTEAIGNVLLKRHPDNIMNAGVQNILRIIARDEQYGGLKAKDAIDLIDAANLQGKPMRVADIGNLEQNPSAGVRTLSGYLGRAPGVSRQMAESQVGLKSPRDLTAGDRLQADLAQRLTGGPSMFEATETLIEARNAAARPLWEKVDAIDVVMPSEHLTRLLNNPDVKQGLKRGFHLERNLADAEKRPFDPTMLGIDFNEAGDIVFTKMPNMRVLQMGKEGLDAMIEAERDSVTGRLSKMGRSYSLLKSSYLNELDALDTRGIYKKARDSWAGYSANLDALKMGKAIFGMGPEEAKHAFSQLGAGEQEFFRLGVADQIREKILKTGFSGDEAKSIIKNPWMKMQLRPAFRTDKDFDAFLDSVSKEGAMFRTTQDIFSNSKTAERVFGDAAGESGALTDPLVKSHGLHAAANLFHGNFLRAAANTWRMFHRVGLKPDPKLNEAMAKVMFMPEGIQLLQNPPSVVRAKPFAAAEDFAPYLAAATGQAASGVDPTIQLPAITVGQE